MRSVSMTRWSTGTREYFSIRVDQPAISPSVVMNWQDKGESYQANLVVTATLGKIIEGYLDTQVVGSFILSGTIESIEVISVDGSFTSGVEKPPAEDTILPELQSLKYDDPLSLTSWGINRLIDDSSSGIRLIQEIALGWMLPGIMQPETVDEDRIQEMLLEPFDMDDTALNKLYMVGSELVFLRSNGQGSEALRAPLTSVYSFQVSPFSPRQILSNEPAEYDIADKVVDPPAVPDVAHFAAELADIFNEELKTNVPNWTYTNISYVGTPWDRPAEAHYSRIA